MAKVEPKKVFLVAPLVWALFIFQQAESLSATIESDLSEPAYQLLAKRTDHRQPEEFLCLPKCRLWFQPWSSVWLFWRYK
jgi:hypothetical protein